ncbi:MAG: hypothetical protein RLY93_19850 [Sumerlaeia bacterium]
MSMLSAILVIIVTVIAIKDRKNISVLHRVSVPICTLLLALAYLFINSTLSLIYLPYLDVNWDNLDRERSSVMAYDRPTRDGDVKVVLRTYIFNNEQDQSNYYHNRSIEKNIKWVTLASIALVFPLSFMLSNIILDLTRDDKRFDKKIAKWIAAAFLVFMCISVSEYILKPVLPPAEHWTPWWASKINRLEQDWASILWP